MATTSLAICKPQPFTLLSSAQGIIGLSSSPKVVQQNRQFSGDPDYRPFLSVLPSSFSQLQSPAPQVAVRAKGSQVVVGAIDQQLAQVGIPGFGDPQLRFVITRLNSFRDQTSGGPHLAAFGKAAGIFQGQHKG
jgi:hypothetical protein